VQLSWLGEMHCSGQYGTGGVIFLGGLMSAEAQRSLRSHAARILIVDEADACGTGAEGNSIDLAEKRTLTFANWKILIGSTPTFESSSVVLKRYGQSDQRVFEIPCRECGARETLRVWIEEDVDKWRTQGTLRYPPTWRIRSLAASRRSTPYS
jgi:phage terminase large subunit GpA-like protein